MLRTLSELKNYVLQAKDGEIGRCKDFLFDDEQWIIRYMLADTGKFLPGRKVLISPIALGQPDWKSRRFPVNLTKEQIEASPPLETDAPVSRQYEIRWFDHYGWPYYWVGTGAWGEYPTPAMLYAEQQKRENADQKRHAETEDNHLRSMREVEGYHIEATDGEIGHVEEFIADDETWLLRYVVVDTRNWLPGRKVLVSPHWVRSVSWQDHKVYLEQMTMQDIKDSPEYDPKDPVNREYEVQLYDYYGRPKYW